MTRLPRSVGRGAALLFGAVLLVASGCGNGADGTGAFPVTGEADAPFEQFGEAGVTIGGESLRLLVATSPDQRSQGLRGVDDLDGYDGMAFVYPEPGEATFTMAGTLMPLDIGFYDGAGDLVNRLEMAPCAGTDGTCPGYPSGGEFLVAVETPAGALPTGPLGR